MRQVIRLYRAPYSTNCERVGLALAHKGLEAESVLISYDDRSPVEAVSGQGLVPVIVDEEGAVVSDSTAILCHLEDRYPEPALFPAEEARRAEVETFADWFNEVWKLAPNELEAVLETAEPDPVRVAALGARIQGALPRFEAMLAGRDFLMGDSVGAADFLAFPFLKYGLLREADDTELYHLMLAEHQDVSELPRLRAWIERVRALPLAY